VRPGTTSSRRTYAGPGKTLRPRLPDLVHQELWAYLIVHHAISALTAKASAAADLDPDRISFAKALRLIRRTATGTADIPPQDWTDQLPKHLADIADLLIPPRRARDCFRAVKRARHNSYRIKKPAEPASTRHRAPSGSTRSAHAPVNQLTLRGIAPWTAPWRHVRGDRGTAPCPSTIVASNLNRSNGCHRWPTSPRPARDRPAAIRRLRTRPGASLTRTPIQVGDSTDALVRGLLLRLV